MNPAILLQVCCGGDLLELKPPNDQSPQWRGSVSLCECNDRGRIAVLGGHNGILDVFDSQGM